MNNKKMWWVALAVVAVAVVAYGLSYFVNSETGTKTPTNPGVLDPTNTTYMIDNQPVILVNGKAETSAAPGSATKITTSLFGQPVTGDLNGDGVLDAAVVLVQNPGGSGTFYYVAAAVAGTNGTQGTNAILLGDRIAPQTVEIRNGQIIANYADRNPGEPMTAQPSVGVSKYLILNGLTLTPSAPIAGAGERCGGNMTTAPTCISGYHCSPDPASHLPFGDVGGICTAN